MKKTDIINFIAEKVGGVLLLIGMIMLAGVSGGVEVGNIGIGGGVIGLGIATLIFATGGFLLNLEVDE